MLNWIWLGLIVVAVLVAGGRDISELSGDRFRNGKQISIHITAESQTAPDQYTAAGYITKAELASFYSAEEIQTLTADTIAVSMEYTVKSRIPEKNLYGTAVILLGDKSPTVWRDMAAHLGDGKKLSGAAIVLTDSVNRSMGLALLTEPIRFRILSKVVSDGVFKAAETAVTIALGLISVMAFWLGIMKIAEAAGFVTLLAKMAKPIMVRLFPEVPADHPAMGAMLSNMAANFLGLSNAATPLGLKAMEELNKLNKHTGTATNAMCMFLTVNTSAITLVPATVIAVRLSLGSSDPADILVPTFLATLIALICGVMFNRFIQRFFPVKQ